MLTCCCNEIALGKLAAPANEQTSPVIRTTIQFNRNTMGVTDFPWWIKVRCNAPVATHV
jgi:hypothetical protein